MSYLQGLDEQFKIFFYSLGAGAVICIIYECIKQIRNIFGMSNILVFFLDLIFSFIAAIVTFIYMLIMNSGRVRLYILIGELFGFLIYYFTFGKFLSNAFSNIKRKVQKLKKKIFEKLSKLCLKNKQIKFFNLLKSKVGVKKGS